jgi:hypothetical protein
MSVEKHKEKTKMKKSAYEQGVLHGMVTAANNPTPETVILDSMRDNPFKSTQSREDFVKGVSEGVNRLARIRTHKEVYGKAE